MTIERAFENGKIDAELKELGGTRPPELRLPAGFCLDQQGQLCAIVPGKKVKGDSQPTRLQVAHRQPDWRPHLTISGRPILASASPPQPTRRARPKSF